MEIEKIPYVSSLRHPARSRIDERIKTLDRVPEKSEPGESIATKNTTDRSNQKKHQFLTMGIKLKNYTTEVAANRSIELIEKLLVDFGATNIMKEYEELKPLPGRVCVSIAFVIEVDGIRTPIKLPANVKGVALWLRKQKPSSSDKVICEQANRIAWKQQYEILYLQLSQVETQQRELMSVFLPDAYDIENNQTFFQKLKAGGFKQLSNG